MSAPTGDQAEVCFDAESHSADAIQRAAYRFSDRLSLELTTSGGLRRCLLRPRDGVELSEELLSEFRVEVLDHVLRGRVRAETEAVRNVILAHAFSKTGLLDDEPR